VQVIKLTFHSIVHRDIQEVWGSSRILTALVLKFAEAHLGAVAPFTSFHGGYSSGCIESATQPSPMEKSSRITFYYVIQNDGARDLVLPLWLHLTQQNMASFDWECYPHLTARLASSVDMVYRYFSLVCRICIVSLRRWTKTQMVADTHICDVIVLCLKA